jgi:hypothetical protein
MLDVRRVLWLGIVLGAVALASSVALAVGARWHGLRSVTVTVSNPSLPPPNGEPLTIKFLPGDGLSRAQQALNANDIARLSKPRPNTACAGGYNATIEIVKRGGAVVTLSGYRCGTTTFGRVGGNLPGFLKAVGISPP